MNKFIQLTSYPRRLLLNILRFMFCKKNREITLILLAMFLVFSLAEKRAYAAITFNVPVPTEYNWDIDRVDLDRLAYAISFQETKDFTLGCGKTHNNGFGIMTWVNGHREPKRYETKQASIDDFKRIWRTHYGNRIPTYQDAVKWSGNDRAEAWYYNVHWIYNNK